MAWFGQNEKDKPHDPVSNSQPLTANEKLDNRIARTGRAIAKIAVVVIVIIIIAFIVIIFLAKIFFETRLDGSWEQ